MEMSLLLPFKMLSNLCDMEQDYVCFSPSSPLSSPVVNLIFLSINGGTICILIEALVKTASLAFHVWALNADKTLENKKSVNVIWGRKLSALLIKEVDVLTFRWFFFFSRPPPLKADQFLWYLREKRARETLMKRMSAVAQHKIDTRLLSIAVG